MKEKRFYATLLGTYGICAILWMKFIPKYKSSISLGIVKIVQHNPLYDWGPMIIVGVTTIVTLIYMIIIILKEK